MRTFKPTKTNFEAGTKLIYKEHKNWEKWIVLARDYKNTGMVEIRAVNGQGSKVVDIETIIEHCLIVN